MSSSNAWCGFAAIYLRTKDAHGEHELSKAELKKLVPEDAKEASGHRIKAKRSKSGAISFDARGEASDPSIQSADRGDRGRPRPGAGRAYKPGKDPHGGNQVPFPWEDDRTFRCLGAIRGRGIEARHAQCGFDQHAISLEVRCRRVRSRGRTS